MAAQQTFDFGSLESVEHRDDKRARNCATTILQPRIQRQKVFRKKLRSKIDCQQAYESNQNHCNGNLTEVFASGDFPLQLPQCAKKFFMVPNEVFNIGLDFREISLFA